MSIDAFTGRNPSYCFVDFHTEEEAARTMQTMQGQLVRGRPVKINLKTDRQIKPTQQAIKTYDLGWRAKEIPAPEIAQDSMVFDRWSRNDAQSHWTAPAAENRRVFVGGLPRIPNQITLNAEMKALFGGYEIQAVSKLISPHHTESDKPGSHYHAYVDLATAQEATNAVRTLNRTPTPYGGAYHVSRAVNKKGSAIVQREQLGSTARVFVGGLPELQNVDAEIRSIFAGHDVRKVTRLITPHLSKQVGENYFYCFVDFPNPQDAHAAVAAFDMNDRGLKVRFAREWPSRVDGTWPATPRPTPSTPETAHRDYSTSWRRRD